MERGSVFLSLECVEGVIDDLPFSAFGTPVGFCPNYIHAPSCDSGNFSAYAKATCLGKPNCVLNSSAFPDPCEFHVKSIAVVAHCSSPPGGFSPDQPTPYTPPPPGPPPSPSCAANGVPCPVPTWDVTWNLTQSSVLYGGSSGYFYPAHPWGLVSLDWSAATDVWWTGNVSNSTDEATSRKGCGLMKASGLVTRCFICERGERDDLRN
jgi:hypothetical protein